MGAWGVSITGNDTAQDLQKDLPRGMKKIAKGRVICIQYVRHYGNGSFFIFHDPYFFPEADDPVGDFLNQFSLKSSHDHERHAGEIDQPADPDDPDHSAQLLIDELPVHDP